MDNVDVSRGQLSRNRDDYAASNSTIMKAFDKWIHLGTFLCPVIGSILLLVWLLQKDTKKEKETRRWKHMFTDITPGPFWTVTVVVFSVLLFPLSGFVLLGFWVRAERKANQDGTSDGKSQSSTATQSSTSIDSHRPARPNSSYFKKHYWRFITQTVVSSIIILPMSVIAIVMYYNCKTSTSGSVINMTCTNMGVESEGTATNTSNCQYL